MPAHNYVPHYSEETAIKKGQCPPPEDILARQRLMREVGINCCDEVWVPGYGYAPLYACPRELSQAEQDVLCLKPFVKKPTPTTPSQND